MIQDASLLELSGAIYETIQSPRRWPEALRTLKILLEADDCLVVNLEKNGSRIGFAANADGILAAAAPATDADVKIDRRVLVGLDHAPGEIFLARGAIVPSICCEERLADGAGGTFLGLVVANDCSDFTALCATRTGSARDFAEPEQQLMLRLHPHLSRGHALERRLRLADEERRATLAALDHLSAGVIVVDGEGQIQLHNRRAKAILEQRDGLLLCGGLLRAGSVVETAALQEAIRNAVKAPGGAAAAVLSMRRASYSRPLELLVAPLADAGEADGLSGALVFVGDPERRPAMAAEALMQLYGLSPSEAVLAAELASGKTLAQFAEDHARNIETARKTLKRVFAKTDTGRQAELVGRLLSGPATFANGSAIAG